MPPIATPAKVHHLEGTEFQKGRSFSPAVITEGGKIVWLAGQTTLTDLEGKDTAGKFDEQARTIFAPSPSSLATFRPDLTASFGALAA